MRILYCSGTKIWTRSLMVYQKNSPTASSGFFFYMDGDHSGISLSLTPCRLFNLLCFINKRCLPSSGLPDRRRANLRTLLLLNSKRVRSLTVYQKRNPTNKPGFFFYMDGDHSGISLSPTPCRLFNLLCFINKRCLPSSGYARPTVVGQTCAPFCL